MPKRSGAEIYIGVHFNSVDGNDSSTRGTGVYYQPNTSQDSKNKALATALNKNIMKEMGTPEAQGVTEASYTAFNNGRTDAFGGPAMYVEGAFLSNKEDMKIIAKDNEEGLKAYAKGIVAGILEYYNMPNNGYGDIGTSTSTDNENVTTSVNSRVYDLKYIPEKKFDELLEKNDESILQYYTLDSEWKLIVASWNYSSSNGTQYVKNSPINYKTVLQKYTTPFEYLMDFYIDIKDDEFIYDFAKMAMESEFIVAVQDNVTTTQTQTEAYLIYDDGVTEGLSTEEQISESVNTTIELTYADTWFVKFARESTYQAQALQASEGTLVGEQGEYVGEYKITSFCYVCNSDGSGNFGTAVTASGKAATPYRTVAIRSTGDPNGLKLGDTIMFNGHVFVVEDTGPGPSTPGPWLDIYVEPDSQVRGRCCSSSEFGSGTVQVYRANNVHSATSQDTQTDGTLLVNTTANVKGKVTDSTSSSSTSVVGPTKTEYNDKNEKEEISSTRYTTTEVHTISNEYDAGDGEPEINEDKFVELFEDHPEAKDTLKDEWLIHIIEKGDRTAAFTDLTKYLLYKVTNNKFYKDVDIDEFLSRFKENDFISAVRAGKISYQSLNLTQEDKEILYKITSAERGDGTQEQQEYVVSVILNRVLCSDYPNTVKGVVFQPMQFQPTRNGAYERAQPSQTTKNAVDNVIENGGTAGTAVYFMTPAASLTQGWLKDCEFLFNDEDDSLKDTNTNGSHNFYTNQKAKNELEQYMTAGGDIRSVCEEITKLFMSRNAHYGAQTYGNIEKVYNSDTSLVCATYTSLVLYRSGLLTPAQINSYNYHLTSDYPNMLKAAGWHTVSKSDLKPGDVLNKPRPSSSVPGHVVIYIGDGLVYDQKSAVISSSGTPPTGKPANASRYINDSSFVAWRAP